MQAGLSSPDANTGHTGLKYGLAVVLAALLAAALVAMLQAGPGRDDYYTLFVTQPGTPFPRAFVDLWLTDNHPPLFYALAWATNWLGADVETRRLVNLPILIAGIAALVALARRADSDRIVFILYGMGLAGAMPAVEKAAELRSYFLGLVAAAVMMAALYVFARPRNETDRGPLPWVVLSLTLLVALNLHFVLSLICGFIAGACLLRLCAARAWRTAGRLFLACVIGTAPLLACLAWQFAEIEEETRTFWIDPSMTAAARQLVSIAYRSMAANWPLTILAAAGLWLLVLRSRQDRRLDDRLAFVLTIVGALLAALGLLLALHAWRPIIVFRYLNPAFPVIALSSAIGASIGLESLRARASALAAAALTVGAIVSIGLNLHFTMTRPSWYDSGRLVAAHVRQCGGTVVHASMGWGEAPFNLAAADRVDDPEQFTFRVIADQLGFAVESQTSRRMAPRCPTIFWDEFTSYPDPTESDVVARLRELGFAPGQTEMHIAGKGWILVSRPR